jgi:hypothetical protein
MLLCMRSYARIARCSGHSSYVRHLDWSANSRVVQSSCGAYELLYFDAATGKQVGPGCCTKESCMLNAAIVIDAVTEPASVLCIVHSPATGSTCRATAGESRYVHWLHCPGTAGAAEPARHRVGQLKQLCALLQLADS